MAAQPHGTPQKVRLTDAPGKSGGGFPSSSQVSGGVPKKL